MASTDPGSKAYSWPGSGTRCWGVELPSSAKTTVLGGPFTIEMWARYRSDVFSFERTLFGIPQGTGVSNAGLFTNRPGSGPGGSLTARNGATGGTVPVYWTSLAGPPVDWHHITATHVNGAWIVYVDGVARGIFPSAQFLNGDLALYVGRPAALEAAETTCTFPFQWSGDIAEVALYQGAVDPVSIAKHYVASGRTLPDGLSPEELYGGKNPALKCVQCFVSNYTNVTDDPVEVSTGNFWHTFQGIAVPGRGPALDHNQTYNSLNAATNGPFGYGWSFSYGMSLNIGAGNTPVTVSQENGSQVRFSLSGSNYAAPTRVQATLVHNGDGTWTYVRQKRTTFKFDASGKLMSITDRNGYTTSLAYSSGKLTTVTDPAGRTLTFAYNGALVSSVTDTASPARSVQFGYDGAGNLTSLTDVGGGVTTMVYDGSHRLTQMLDPRQQGVSTNYLTNVYDPATGKVTSQTDYQGRTTTFDYSVPNTTTITDGAGHVTRQAFVAGYPASIVKDPGGTNATWQFAIDTVSSRPTGVIDPNGHLTTFSYDAQGNMLSQTDGIDPNAGGPLGRTTSYTYDAQNNLKTVQDPKGVTTTFNYDAQGNLTSTSTPLTSSPGTNQVTMYTYGDAGHPGDVTALIDGDSKTWNYTYTATGDLATSVDPVGNSTKYCYDNVGRRTRMVLPKGSAAGVTCTSSNPTFAYQYTTNAFGDILTTTDPLGHQSSRVYDKNRNVTTATDLNGNQTAYGYNFDSEITTTLRADGTTLGNDYWGDGNLKSQTDGAGQATSYTYDALAHLSSVTDPLNRTTSYGYDAVGNLLAKQDPGGNCLAVPKVACTSYGYDNANQLVATTYSDGSTPNVTYAYDADGQRTSMTDGTGTSTWQYDSLHRLTSYKNGANATIGYGYNLRNLVTSIVYPGSTGTVTRGYDDAGRLHTVTDWASHQTTFDYDADSFLTSQTYPNTTTATYTPDNADRLTGITDKKSGTTFASFAYTLDDAAQVTGVTSTGVPADNHTYSYNQLNQLKTQDSTTLTYDAADNPTKLPLVANQAFDAANQLTSTSTQAQISLVGTASKWITTCNPYTPSLCKLDFPAGVAAGDTILVGVTMNQSTSVTTPAGYTQVSGSPFSSGTGSNNVKLAIFRKTATAGESAVSFSFGGFDSTLKVITLAVYRGVDSSSPIDGSVTSAAASSGTSLTAPSITTTVPNGRLVMFASERCSNYAPDWSFSATMTREVQRISPVGNGVCAAGAIADEQLTTTGATGTRTATTSQSGAIIAAQLVLKASNTTPAPTYAYDQRGNRTTTTPPGGSPTTLGYDQANRLTSYGTTAAYGYNGDGLRMSKNVSGTITQQTWDVAEGLPLLLVDGSTNYIYGPNGLPLEQLNGSTVTYYHHDQLGSTRVLTDGSGDTVATYTYDAYGRQTASTGTATNPFGYAGQYTDAESGLQYLRARYYDPATAQFLTRDPVVTLTRSAYGYVGNNPNNGTDPTGLDCSISLWDWGDCVEDAADATTEYITNPHNLIDIGTGFVAAVGVGACVSTVVCPVLVVAGAFVGGTAAHLLADEVFDDPDYKLTLLQALGHAAFSSTTGGLCGAILGDTCFRALQAGGWTSFGGAVFMVGGFIGKWFIDQLSDLVC